MRRRDIMFSYHKENCEERFEFMYENYCFYRDILKSSLIAILPIGYADGYPRNLSCGQSYVLIDGHKVPVVGKICMDQLAVDVTDIPDIKVGKNVTLIGKEGNEEISAPMVADKSESITNELLSRIGNRLGAVTIRE